MDNYNIQPNNGMSISLDISTVMKRVYLKMFLALLVTAATAYGIALLVPQFIETLATNSWIYWGCAIAEIILVIAIGRASTKMKSSTATLLFYLFAILNGVTFSLILAVYTQASIFKTFLITAGVFGAMSVYGYFTDRDLSKIGTYLYMALFGLIICIIVNLFMKSSSFEWIISGIGVLIFIGITAWDTQKIKRMAEYAPIEEVNKIATIGALSLYLDFINLFIYLLRFFGASRN
ncbi:MAG: Bax inhibitor-1/YccA family protein [Muribaculaceae bacterium]|nr:Bax inhibitor-1/YccA family protein [Muribaculaceae bacterium]